ncbi:MAG: hypothetical protein R8K21_03285 [Mariprofundales bacterium]
MTNITTSTQEQRSSLAIGTLLRNRYRIIEVLNDSDPCCLYYRAEDNRRRYIVCEFFPIWIAKRNGKDMELLASKYKPHFRYGMEQFSQYGRLLNKLQLELHPTLCVHNVFPFHKTGYMLMADAPGETLANTIKKNGCMSTVRAINSVKQIISFIEPLHTHKVLHLNIHPDSIIVDPNNKGVLLSAPAAGREIFARKIERQSETNISGFAAPECYDVTQELNFNIDIYAIAALLYYMQTGTPPPDSRKPKAERVAAINKHFADKKGMQEMLLHSLTDDAATRSQNCEHFLKNLDVLDALGARKDKKGLSKDQLKAERMLNQVGADLAVDLKLSAADQETSDENEAGSHSRSIKQQKNNYNNKKQTAKKSKHAYRGLKVMGIILVLLLCMAYPAKKYFFDNPYYTQKVSSWLLGNSIKEETPTIASAMNAQQGKQNAYAATNTNSVSSTNSSTQSANSEQNPKQYAGESGEATMLNDLQSLVNHNSNVLKQAKEMFSGNTATTNKSGKHNAATTSDKNIVITPFEPHKSIALKTVANELAISNNGKIFIANSSVHVRNTRGNKLYTFSDISNTGMVMAFSNDEQVIIRCKHT